MALWQALPASGLLVPHDRDATLDHTNDRFPILVDKSRTDGREMTQDQAFECNSPDVVYEAFGDEVIILNLQSGSYYSLDRIGMLYWEFLNQAVPPRGIEEHFCQLFAGQCDRAVLSGHLEALLAQFRAEGLIRPGDTSRAIAELLPAKTTLCAEYTPPVLSRFDDLSEMLLLDPVHDVSDLGWPHSSPTGTTEDLKPK